MEFDDLKFAWAAYRKGALNELFENRDMTADEFKNAFQEIGAAFDDAWIMSAETKEGFVPIGLVVGNWHPLVNVMIASGAFWFPWASKRNITEGIMHFLNEMRKEVQIMAYVKPEHRKLYEVAAMHGIMRRIGKSENMFEDAQATLFETRAIK